jgi:hypothetical protein
MPNGNKNKISLLVYISFFGYCSLFFKNKEEAMFKRQNGECGKFEKNFRVGPIKGLKKTLKDTFNKTLT